jgi:hypothetical protein
VSSRRTPAASWSCAAAGRAVAEEEESDPSGGQGEPVRDGAVEQGGGQCVGAASLPLSPWRWGHRRAGCGSRRYRSVVPRRPGTTCGCAGRYGRLPTGTPSWRLRRRARGSPGASRDGTAIATTRTPRAGSAAAGTATPRRARAAPPGVPHAATRRHLAPAAPSPWIRRARSRLGC